MSDPASIDPAADERFMRLALDEARAAASLGEVPIGAVVVCDGVVVSRGGNRRETDADPTAHAEMIAVRGAARELGRWRLSGCTVYVTLEPCPMCAGALHAARVDRCVFGATDPKAGAVGTLYDIASDERLNHRYEVTAGVLAEESAELLRGFFASLRSSGREPGPLEG
jgi:tRNA(adenine34) deaminase